MRNFVKQDTKYTFYSRKKDQKMGKPAGKEGNMEDYQKTMGKGQMMMVKMKTLEEAENALRGSQYEVKIPE